MTDRCEPPPELRGVDGWHWLGDGCPVFWIAEEQEWDWTEDEHVAPDAAYRYGYRYLSPVATPAEVEALRAERDRIVAEARDCARTLAAYTRDLEVISGHTHRAIAENATLRARVAKLEGAAADMLAGWRYIRRIHGDLPGIGWDRAQQAVEAALGTAAPIPLAPLSAEEQRQARAALSPATEAAQGEP